MAIHCGAPTRDGSACERHVPEQGMRCFQHTTPAVEPPHVRIPPRSPLPPMRTVLLEDPVLDVDVATHTHAPSEDEPEPDFEPEFELDVPSILTDPAPVPPPRSEPEFELDVPSILTDPAPPPVRPRPRIEPLTPPTPPPPPLPQRDQGVPIHRLPPIGSRRPQPLFRDEVEPPVAVPVSTVESGPLLEVPEFLVPGFGEEVVPADPATGAPLGTVLSSVLGPELWRRCHVEWTGGHCIALARMARDIDGLAPAAATSIRSTAGAGLRWLGATREQDDLAGEVAAAIAHPDDASKTNSARTVRLYGAAICVAVGRPLRRCACHRDLARDVSSELIELGLAGLADPLPEPVPAFRPRI